MAACIGILGVMAIAAVHVTATAAIITKVIIIKHHGGLCLLSSAAPLQTATTVVRMCSGACRAIAPTIHAQICGLATVVGIIIATAPIEICINHGANRLS